MIVYLSGPITARDGYTVEQNVREAVEVYLRLINAGVHAFCPHLCAAFPEAFTIPYEKWMAYDLAMIDLCTHVLMLPRWTTSPGAIHEREYAAEMNKIIVYDEETLLLLARLK